MSLHPIFEDCCADKGSPVEVMQRPFHVGEYAYATDGRFCVRCHTLDMDLPLRTTREPAVELLDWSVPDAPEVALPDVGSGIAKCELCGGTGKLVDFEVDESGSEYTGECWECEGDGQYHDFTRVEVGPVWLATWAVARLRRHNVTHVRPRSLPKVGQRKGAIPAVYFKGDGFEGLLSACEAPASVG